MPGTPGQKNYDSTPAGEQVTWFAVGDNREPVTPFLRYGLIVLVNCMPNKPGAVGLLIHDLLNKAYGARLNRPLLLFVNVGCGDVISLENLMAVLERDLFSRAVLDGFGEELLSVDDPLWAHKVVVVGEGCSGSGRFEENLVVITPRVTTMLASVDEIVALYRENLLAFTGG